MNDGFTRREALGLGAGLLSALAWGCAARDDGHPAIGAAMGEGASPVPGAPLSPEDGYEAWLRYRPLAPARRDALAALLGDGIRFEQEATPVLASACDELVRGLSAMLGETVGAAGTGGLLLGPAASSAAIRTRVSEAELEAAGAEGYVLRTFEGDGGPRLVIASLGERASSTALPPAPPPPGGRRSATVDATERPRLRSAS